MPQDFLKQENKPLFPNILWNRPLNRAQGGRILIIGGQKSGFNECQALFQMAQAAGAGECQIILPDSLQKTVGQMGIGHFVPSSPSGSLGKSALGEILMMAGEYDAVIIAGNLTNNSETAVLIESFIDKYARQLIISEEVLEIMKFNPHKISQRKRTLVVTDSMAFFKWANTLEVPFGKGDWDNLLPKLAVAQEILRAGKADYAVFNGQIFIPGEQNPSSTVLPTSLTKLPAAAIATLGVFWLQNPDKPFEALTTGAYVLQQAALTAEKPLGYTNLSKAASTVLDKESF